MNVFFRCSFPASRGFKNAKYDEKGQLAFLTENDLKMPLAVRNMLKATLKYTMVLATDENTKPIFGVFQPDENIDTMKYVNAVFSDDEHPEKVFAVYQYFCTHRLQAIQALMDSVQRKREVIGEDDVLEYFIDRRTLDSLFAEAEKAAKAVELRKDVAGNALLAFISTKEFDNYETNLKETCKLSFDRKRIFVREKIGVNDDTVADYLSAFKKTGVSVLSGELAAIAVLFVVAVWLAAKDSAWLAFPLLVIVGLYVASMLQAIQAKRR